MATRRPSATPLSLLFACLFIGIVVLVSAAPALAKSHEPSDPETELICHTSNPDDCYPKIFQATDEFQIVREDQDLPIGLHVRLNVQTGQKEAKINVPDEIDPALEGLPVDHSIVIVDPQEAEAEAPLIPKGAPAYEAVGKIKEPEHEASSFHEALKMVKSGPIESSKDLDEALEGLEDISHDIYYGLKITEDPSVLRALFCLMADNEIPAVEEGVVPRGQQAASILGSALQNNPTALKEVAKNWKELMRHQCAKDGARIDESFYGRLVSLGARGSKAKVAAIDGLIKDDQIRADFMAHGGMQRLLEVLLPTDKEWEGAQRKAGQLVLDNFLDESMGAKLGQWPTARKVEDSVCQTAESGTQEGCWDYHVARIMKANKGKSGHWSKDVNDRLAKIRKSSKQHLDL